MERYFKIGEISALYDIGVDSLRYYEKLGLIHPIRSESGYRLYRVRDIWCLNVIRELRGLDFSMEQIWAYLSQHTTDSTLELLAAESRAIGEKLDLLQRLRANVEQRMENIRDAMQQPVNQIQAVEYPARRCFFIAHPYRNDNDAEMDILIKQLLNCDTSRCYIIGSQQIGSVLQTQRAQTGDFSQYSGAFLLTSEGDQELPAGTYLTVRYRGSYGQIAQYVPLLFHYAAQQGYCPAGDILELLCIDIHTTADPAEFVTELQMRVTQSKPDANPENESQCQTDIVP